MQPKPDSQWHAVGQPELATFVWRVSRLSECVVEVLQTDVLVVALDGEDLAQQALQTSRGSLICSGGLLKKSFV